MGNCLWGDDSPQRFVGVLKPFGNIDFNTFVIGRLLIAIYFTLHAASHVVLIPIRFWEYLTNWGLISCAVLYLSIVIAHAMNGDFSKNNYVVPTSDQVAKINESRLQKWIVGMYEWSLHLSLMITLAFWLVEIPAMGNRGDFGEI